MIVTTLLTFLPVFSLPLTLAAPASTPLGKRDTAPIYDGSQVNGKTYDYIIVGGGLSGVVLAARLTEDSSKSVLVVESGYNEENNNVVTDASKYQQSFDTFLDWAYKTVPQSSANGQQQTLRSGRALGGSTAINGLAWSKPHDFQIDAMESVGNAGLNWNSLQTYMRKAENFQAPSSSQAAAGVTYSSACHASNGPINVQYDPNAYPSNLERDFNSTVLKRLPYVTDLTCGNPGGAAPIANTRSGGTRVDAYRGYLWNRSKPNLTILSGANVGKVLFSTSSTPRANGVEFRDEKSNTYTASARREVIMAAGSIKTPVILQQSGIGPRDVLSAAGVAVKVDLPVGLNLIDQTTTTTDWGFNANRGGGQVITFPRFQDLVNGDDATRLRGMLQNDIASYAQAAVSSGSHSSAAGLQKVLEIQRDWILNKNAGVSESFDYSFGTTLGYDSWYLLPFGRGSIKIRDNQPYGSNTAIDPKYFSNPFDRLAQGATARYTRTTSQTTPLSYDVTGESVPGGAVQGNDLEGWSDWAQANYRSNWHPIGTAAMMSRDLGGVVDSRNRVYGVDGLRIVDGSTLPFQVSAHLMSVLYGLAERAADLIKQDNSGTTPPTSSSVRPASSSSTSSTRPTSSTAPPSTTGRAIHPNGDTSKCLQARGQSDGALVEIRDCNDAASQRWIISSGRTSVKLAGTNYCLDAGSNPANGAQGKVWTCYDGIPAQTWNYNSGNRIALATGNQCLDLPDGNKSNGNVLQTWQCFSDNANQRWTV